MIRANLLRNEMYRTGRQRKVGNFRYTKLLTADAIRQVEWRSGSPNWGIYPNQSGTA
jgi:hypothetical protein